MLGVCLWRWRKGTVREVLMWHSDEWVLWLDFTCWKHLSGLWESESKGLMSCETKSQGVNKFMNWFLGHISVGMIFWDCRNFVWCMPIWEIGSWGSAASCQRKPLLRITKCVSAVELWTTFVPGNHQCDIASHLSSRYFEFLVGSVVTLIWWQITTALFELGRTGERQLERL